MKILVLNCGSSSIKYQFLDVDSEKVLAKGSVERLGNPGPEVDYKRHDGLRVKKVIEGLDHHKGIEFVLNMLQSEENGVIKNLSEINAVGHRVVHGAEKFKESVLITPEVIDMIKECYTLAPLHNPANMIGIDACSKVLPNVPQIAVFDTAFHSDMPDYAYMYGLPYEQYEKYGIRRYGFHGTSHRYVSGRACKMLGKPASEAKIITCHLGNGGSMAAVKAGKSIDTTMGFTPLEGLLMGTRTGDLDPQIVIYLMETQGLSREEVNDLLNKKSGLLGLYGPSSDMRDIEDQMLAGEPKATLAYNMYCYRLKKYIGAYTAALDGVDAIVFTGGIGEHSPLARRDTMKGLTFLGVEIDLEKNDSICRGNVIEADITTKESKVRVLVIPTNEELVIAQDTAAIVKKL